MAEEEKIKFNEEEYNRSKPLIELQIKALIARDLYDMGGYFQIINEANNIYHEAIRIVSDENKYTSILQ